MAYNETMEFVCKKKGSKTSESITRSTGLAESIAIAAADMAVEGASCGDRDARGKATTFFSYSWTGTKLDDMLFAIERKVEALEKLDGRRRYVWIDMFCASQTLLAGTCSPDDGGKKLKDSNPVDYGKRKEQTDKLFDGAIAAVSEVLFYCSPLADEGRSTHHYLLPGPRRAREGLQRKGHAATRSSVSLSSRRRWARSASCTSSSAPTSTASSGFSPGSSPRFSASSPTQRA